MKCPGSFPGCQVVVSLHHVNELSIEESEMDRLNFT